MRAALVILLVSWVYAGCATARRVEPPAVEEIRGGVIRLLPADPQQAEAIRAASVSGRLAPEGLLEPIGGESPGDTCEAFRVEARARFPDGAPVNARGVVDAWEAAIAAGKGASPWLLERVNGVEQLLNGEARHARGLQPEDGRLVICSDRPTPDWPARHAHPDLALVLREGESGRLTGPGPFVTTENPALLVAATGTGGGAASIDRVEFLDPRESDAAQLFAAGAVDVAVVSSRAAAVLLDDAAAPVALRRLPGWDTVYALWISDRARWVNDPRFRAWLAASIDRETMLRFLFDGMGEAAFRLSGPGEAEWRVPDKRPFSADSSPRLELDFDSGDLNAASIASRLKAVLEQHDLTISLQPTDAAGMGERIEARNFQMVLLAHRPPVEDPVLRLQHTLWPLGDSAGETWQLLDRASWWPDAARRRSAAMFAEDTLLRDARLVPLVRVGAWLATHPGLEGVSAGPWGLLRLDGARWRR